MSDPHKVYSREELEGLSEQDKRTLQKELQKEIEASEDFREIVRRFNDMNERLKVRVSSTFNQLKSQIGSRSSDET